MVRSLDGPSSAKDDNKLGSSFVAILIIATGIFRIGTTIAEEVSGGERGKVSLLWNSRKAVKKSLIDHA